MKVDGSLVARGTHHRSEDKTKDIAWMRGSSSRFALTASELDEIGGDSHSWRDLSSPALIAAIEETNAVDMELYRFAVQRFEERFGEPCLGNGNGNAPKLKVRTEKSRT